MRRKIAALLGGEARKRGAVTVEYALGLLVAATLLAGVERLFFRPMAKTILDEFIAFVAPPFP